MERLRILHLEDNIYDAELVHTTLLKDRLDPVITRVDKRDDFERILSQEQFDLILCDYNLPSFDGLSALSIARQMAAETPLIFVSGTIGEERAIDSLKNGATDYVLKDNLQRLPSAVRRALQEQEERVKHRKAELELQLAETRYRTIFESSGTAMAVIEEEDMMLSLVNSNFAKLFGYSKEEIQNKMKWTEFAHQDDLPRMKEYHVLRRTSSGSAPREYEFRLRHKSGALRHVHMTIEMVPETKTSIASLIDITERKQAEEQLRQQAALLDIDPNAIMVRDMDDRIIFWNKGAEKLYEWTKEEMIGKRWSEIQYRDMKEEYAAAMKTVLERSEWHGEWTHKTKSGKEIIVDCFWKLVKDEKGNPSAIYLVKTDITEKKKIQAQYLRVQRMESIGTLASGIAHDLNNALGPVFLGIHFLRNTVTDEKGQRTLHLIEASTKRAADMVKQVLLFARGGDGGETTLQIRHVINEIESIIRDTFPKSIEISTNIPKGLALVKGDATQIHQVMMNLCVNARDAMPEGGALTITAENVSLDGQTAAFLEGATSGDYVVIRIQDTGVGMSEEVKERIFEPFFTTKAVGKGTGLGLSTSLGIIKSHRGFMNVESEQGKGTRIDIYFPAVSTPQTEEGTEKREEFPQGHGETVLVVDDESSIREISRATLESYGYQALLAADGVEGVALFAKHMKDIDAVVCDINMPHLDGTAMLHAVRKMKPSVAVLVMSGVPLGAVQGKLAEDVKPFFLQKPFSVEVFLTTLDKALKSALKTWTRTPLMEE